MPAELATHQTAIMRPFEPTDWATFLAAQLSAQHTTHGSAVYRTILAAIGTTISRPNDAAELSAEQSADRAPIDSTVFSTQCRTIDTTHYAAHASAFG